MNLKKIVSLFLTLAALTGTFIVNTSSADTESAALTETPILPLSDQPEIIRRSEISLDTYTKRLPEEEQLNTIVYENNDGTHVTYMFSHDVKYVDTDGITKDISNDIVQVKGTKGQYVNEASSFKCLLPAELSANTKIAITNSELDICFAYPETFQQKYTATVNGNTVSYGNAVQVVADYTRLVIIMKSDGESLTLDSGNHKVTLADGILSIGDTEETATKVYTVSNSATLAETTSGKFALASTAQTRSTAYNTIIVEMPSSGTAPIVDTMLDPVEPNTNFGSSTYIAVGNEIKDLSETVFGHYYTVMDFPGAYNAVDVYALKNATLHLTVEVTNQSNYMIDVGRYAGFNWSENTLKYSNATLTPDKTYGMTSTSGGTAVLDIKEVLFDGKASNLGGFVNQGIILSPYFYYDSIYSEDSYVFFYSTEAVSGKPYLTLTTYDVDETKFMFKVLTEEDDLSGFDIYLYPKRVYGQIGTLLGPYTTNTYGQCYIDLESLDNYTYNASDTFGINIFKPGYETYCFTRINEMAPPEMVLTANVRERQNNTAFMKPLPDIDMKSYITEYQNFGWRYVYGSQFHNGCDIGRGKVSYDAPIKSISVGQVVECKYTDDTGNMIKIAYPTKENPTHYITYMHMKEMSSHQVDSIVLAGQTIGKVGFTGLGITADEDSSHLHLEISVVQYDGTTKFVDPFYLINADYQYKPQ